ncbi:MAG: glycosyltransferase family 1 protein [Panacibacter sp.]
MNTTAYKKYFDNIIFYLQRSGGGSVYWGEIIKRFNEQSNVNFIEPSISTNNIVRNTLNLHHVASEKKIPLSLLRYLPLTKRLDAGDFFHSSYYRFSKQQGVRNMVTVHDFVYERYNSGIKKYMHHKQKAACVHRAAGIVCISESTKKDLLHYIPAAASKKVKVIYNGVSEMYQKLPDTVLITFNNYTLFKKYKVVLYIGHRTAYKNFAFAAEVVNELPADYHFAVVGHPLSVEETKTLQTKLGKRFSFLGNVTDHELNCIYNLSHCLLYPSYYEGFGIPVLEAFRCGCPVVALNTSSIPEVAGNAALLCNELTVASFKEKISSAGSAALRNELAAAGWQQASKFSWNKCFEELNEFYDTIANN